MLRGMYVFKAIPFAKIIEENKPKTITLYILSNQIFIL